MAAKAETITESKWKVTDTNAQLNAPPRYHDCVVDGQIFSYGFAANTPTEMPEAHARKFVPNESFKVFNDEGKQVSAVIPVLKGYSGDRESIIGEDECIAKFDELTAEALYERAAPMPGGEKLKKSARKEDLIAFLTKARREKIAATKPAATAEDSDGNRDEFSGADLDRLMPLGAAPNLT